jgi:hypothetical protein
VIAVAPEIERVPFQRCMSPIVATSPTKIDLCYSAGICAQSGRAVL